MRKIYSALLLQLALVGFIFAQPNVKLVEYATGLPNDLSSIEHANDGRLFVTEQLGYIWILQPSGEVSDRPFLDIHDKVTPNDIDSVREQGLLGLAFSPNYATDGYFYVNYTNKVGLGNTIIARYQVSPDEDSANPASEQILLNIYQPYTNHNGGSLKFGADGYLYCSLGDGGLGGDPGNRAQNTDTLLGKILRIDVSGNGAYTVPVTNPFAITGGAPEVWAYGLRNPWRMSFDRMTNNLWIADVGQENIEEINFQPAISIGAKNYGWRCYEGNAPYNTTSCSGASSYEAPVYTYTHDNGACSVTGGYVYRGSQNPAMYGYYFFADYCNGLMSTLTTDGNYTRNGAGDFSGKLFSTFGEDTSGELYVADHSSGTIYHIMTSDPLSVNNPDNNVPYSKVYPQPNNGNFTCEFNLAANARMEIQVMDATGRVFYQQNQDFVKGRNLVPLNLQNMANGTYILQLKTAGGSTHHKFLIAG